MAPELQRDEPIDVGVRRILVDCLDRAVHALDSLDDDPESAVHQARKRCKECRAVLRMVGPAMRKRTYRRANADVRDAARRLSPLRDASALRDSVAELGDLTDGGELDALVEVLDERRADVLDGVSAGDARIGAAREALAEVRDAVGDWRLDLHGPADLTPGVVAVYRRGRRALADVRTAPTGDRFHDWRKRAKYTRHHLEVVGPAAPVVLGPLRQAFSDLGDLLGEAHDLDVVEALFDDPMMTAMALEDVAAARTKIAAARAQLEAQALSLGSRLYVERPAAFGERIARYVAAWHDEPVVDAGARVVTPAAS